MAARVGDLAEAEVPQGIRILPVTDRRDALALARVWACSASKWVPAARRRDVGTAITASAIDDARDEADLTWLHPSPEGLAVYEHMGFRRVCDWEVWVRRPAP